MNDFITVESQPYCQIEYSFESKCVMLSWQGFAKSHQFRKSIETVIELTKTHTVESILSDTRHQDIVTHDDIEWLTKEAHPKFFHNGVRRLAFVSSNNPFAARGQNVYAEKTKGALELNIQWFQNPNLAKAWIKQQN